MSGTDVKCNFYDLWVDKLCLIVEEIHENVASMRTINKHKETGYKKFIVNQ